MVKQISIVGGGIAGLVLGQCLRRRQIPAIIWEKSKQIPPMQNFGITLQANVYQSLVQQLELDESSFVQENAIKFNRQPQPGSPIRVNRSALLRTLAKDLDIRWDHKLDSISKGNNARHRLSFLDRDMTHECDLVLVSDGVHSAARNSLELDKDAFSLEVLPFVVYNGKRRFSIDSIPKGLAECLDNPQGLSHSVANMRLQITSGYLDQTKNEIGINYTFSRPAEETDDALLGRSNADAESLAARFVEEVSQLSDLPEPFKTVFAPDLMQNDRLLHWLMRSALLDKTAAMRLAHDGIVILGDAASPQPILGGGGANAAMLDALTLGHVIDESGSVNVAEYSSLHSKWSEWKQEAEQSLHNMHQPQSRASI